MSVHPLDRVPVPPEPPEERRVPYDDRVALRFFAFYIANGTLIINQGPGDPAYDHLIGVPGDGFGDLVRTWLLTELDQGPSPERWLHTWATTGQRAPVAPLPDDAPPWMRVVADFAHDLGHRRLAPDLLGKVAEEDWEGLLCFWGGSPLEGVFAVLGNCIELDGDGQVVNAAWAVRRACWRLALVLRDDLEDTVPPSRDWEGTLWA